MVDKGARTDAVPARSWAALALLFVIGVVNYLDRSIISILQIPMKAELGFSDRNSACCSGHRSAWSTRPSDCRSAVSLVVRAARACWLRRCFSGPRSPHSPTGHCRFP